MPQVKMNVELIKTDNLYPVLRGVRKCYESMKNSDSTYENGIFTLGAKDRKRLLSCVADKHESVLEHGCVTVSITGISRTLTHQLVRHRLNSYSQRSQRYVKEIDFDYVLPSSYDNELDREMSRQRMETIAEWYRMDIASGKKPEDARYILPNACATSIQVTMNFRNLRDFYFKRGENSHAQEEIRELALAIIQVIPDNDLVEIITFKG